MRDPQSFPIDEQESGSYLAILTDDLGSVVPASALTSLQITLYVIRADGSIAYVNNRVHQSCLNQNNVTVFESLQILPDGRRYNLRWQIQPEDSTLQEALLFETHHFLFEWTWAQGQGKHEGRLVVKNIPVVPQV